MDIDRRQFLRAGSAAVMGSSLVALGFSPAAALAEARQFKLARSTEARNTCPYCSVGCGVIVYSLGDRAKNVVADVVHIEGDPNHPVSRGALCAKGAGLLDFVHSPNRLKYPEVREPGTSEWKRVGWDEAMARIAKLMKADRDAHFVARSADGKTVNRWLSTGMLCASSASNESAYLTHKAMRSMGLLLFDSQARV